ncbi:MAG: HlyD family efflux transporter periplasmic adaptor subunit [Cyanobacteria bacterium J06581_3]
MNLGVLNQSATTGERSSVRWRWIWVAALLGMTGLVGWRVWQLRAARISAAKTEAVMPEITTVTALGRLEPAGELVSITAPTSVQESRIGELMVAEGDVVEAGDVIAILDNRDRLQAALQSAERQVDSAIAQQAQIEAGAKSGEISAQAAEISRLEAEQAGNLEAQRATIARIQAEVNNARDDFARYESLYQRGAISASERDSRRLTLTTTEQRLAEARATLSRLQTTSTQQISQARSTLDRIAEVRPVDVDIARAEVRAAEASVAEAEANLEQAFVRSPRAGQVIDIHTYAGETVSSDGIVSLGQTQQMMAVLEVYQDDIDKIEPGQPVSLTSTAIPETLEGTVQRTGLQIGQQQVVNEDPTANIDAKVVDVHVELDEDSNERTENLTNLQVTGTITFK